MSTTIQNIHLQSSPLSDQYLSVSYSTSEQIKQYVSAMINAIEIPTIPEINLSDYAQLSDIPNLSNVAKLNKENIFTENNTFTDVNANEISSERVESKQISANTVDTRNLLLGDSNEKYGEFVFASGEKNKTGSKGFYYGAIELSNDIHPDTIYIYLKKDQPEYDERCGSKDNVDRKNKAILHEYSSPLISSDVSNTAIPTLIEKDIDVFNYMKDNYSNNELSGILLNVVNSSKRAFRRITIEKFATINDEIRYDVLECKVDTLHKLFDGTDIIETIFSTTTYDYDDYSVVFCGHPEIGLNTNVSKNAAAIGTKNISMGRETISLGKENYVEGNYATAIGRKNKVYGYIGFASGSNCQAGISSDIGSMHAEGNQTSALASGSHTEGYNTAVYPGCDYSHAEGYSTKVLSGKWSHAEGYMTETYGECSHTEGYNTKVYGNRSHAEGCNTIAYGEGSHVEGDSCSCDISALYSHAEGYKTLTIGQKSHAEGHMTIAQKYASHAEGCHSISKHNYSFVWSGKDLGNGALSSNYYSSHSNGSFNINPNDGLNGFYIGNANFIDCVFNAISSMNETQKGQLKTILGIS